MVAPQLRRARVRVPCSTSNLGAGFDALGLAFDRHISAEFIPGPGQIQVQRHGTCALLSDAQDALMRAFVFRLTESRVFAAGTLVVDSAIPLSRGLGSSAASVVAGLALGEAVLGIKQLNADRVLSTATELEGHPDNAAPSLFGGLVAVARRTDQSPRALALPLSPDIGFAFAAPSVEVSTPVARRALPPQVPHELAARGLGRMAALLQGFATADAELLRIGFDDELHVPYRLPLIPNAERARRAALEAGAWAVTISGSGSGLIAVGSHEQVAGITSAMAAAFEQSDPGQAFVATPETRGAILEFDS